jgi:hypothetical protein
VEQSEDHLQKMTPCSHNSVICMHNKSDKCRHIHDLSNFLYFANDTVSFFNDF